MWKRGCRGERVLQAFLPLEGLLQQRRRMGGEWDFSLPMNPHRNPLNKPPTLLLSKTCLFCWEESKSVFLWDIKGSLWASGRKHRALPRITGGTSMASSSGGRALLLAVMLLQCGPSGPRMLHWPSGSLLWWWCEARCGGSTWAHFQWPPSVDLVQKRLSANHCCGLRHRCNTGGFGNTHGKRNPRDSSGYLWGLASGEKVSSALKGLHPSPPAYVDSHRALCVILSSADLGFVPILEELFV